MYCPQCRSEYREGFTECADCKVPLRAGAAPPEPPDSLDPSMELVVVLESNEPMQIAMATGLLEDAGIPFFVLGGITRLVNDVTPFLNKVVRVQVPRDREQEAREVIASLLDPVAAPESDSDDSPEDLGPGEVEPQ